MAQEIKQNVEARQELQLRLTPSLIQTVEILQMPLQELIEHIEQEVTVNPFLDVSNSEYTSIDTLYTESKMNSTILEELDEEKGGSQVAASDKEDDIPWWEIIKDDREDLNGKIMMQISVLNVDKKTESILCKILEKVDADGFLRMPLEGLLEYVKKELNQDVSMEEIKNALYILRTKVEPKGIGSTNLVECLLSQVDSKHPQYTLIQSIISNDIMNHRAMDINNLSQKYSKSVEEISEALHVISKLNMYPFSGYSNETYRRIKPDAEIYYVGDELVVNVSNPYLPKLSLNKEYVKLLSEKKVNNFLKDKYLSAKKVIKDINLRKMFLLKILRVIAEEQRGFFEDGIVSMKVLNLETLSQKTGLSKSTISRVISNKYIQTPRGLFNIKFFLASSPSRNTKVHYSKLSICDKIKELISVEDKQSPYTDSEIKQAIERELNITLARRTITKFRLEMNIPSASARKAKYASTDSSQSVQNMNKI